MATVIGLVTQTSSFLLVQLELCRETLTKITWPVTQLQVEGFSPSVRLEAVFLFS